LLMAALFAIYIYIRCRIQPELGPTLPREELDKITWRDRFVTLRAGILPLVVFGAMMGLFLTGVTSLVESSAVGALLATLAALFTGRLNKAV
ncbi:hypothetical protein LNK15_13020, partial [Jeotgalicoccus huakuii]|nr:hypothetical protein [Jeotgalicoccus huakuii]